MLLIMTMPLFGQTSYPVRITWDAVTNWCDGSTIESNLVNDVAAIVWMREPIAGTNWIMSWRGPMIATGIVNFAYGGKTYELCVSSDTAQTNRPPAVNVPLDWCTMSEITQTLFVVSKDSPPKPSSPKNLRIATISTINIIQEMMAQKPVPIR